jgi:deoxyribodipyrimidine photo-lyase
MWFRRDLRLSDLPALRAAADAGADGVVPLFVLDPTLWGPAGPNRRAYLCASLRELSQDVGGLQLRSGDPVDEVVAVARAAGAGTVHVSADFGPYGRERDTRVEKTLQEHGIRLERTGSPYAVAPGRVTKPDGSAYRVFTPFSRAWAEHGWRPPVPAPTGVRWTVPLPSSQLPEATAPDGVRFRRQAKQQPCSAGGRTSRPP